MADDLDSDINAQLPKPTGLRYDRQQLLYFKSILSEEEELQRWNQILDHIGPLAFDLLSMDKTSNDCTYPKRKNKESRRQRARKNKQEKKEHTNPGSLLLIKSEEQCFEERTLEEQNSEAQCYEEIKLKDQCYEELPCSGFSEVKAAELQQGSNWSYAEEEEEDFEDSEDEFYGLLKPAFFVEGEPDFASGPPQDGLEYLRRVRWEAARCPKVKIANPDIKKLKKQTLYMPNIPPVPECSIDLLPSKDWEREFLADFSNLRMALSNAEVEPTNGLHIKSLPSHRDKAAWERLCFGFPCRLSSNEGSCSQTGRNEKAKDDSLEDVDLGFAGTSQECQQFNKANCQGKDPGGDCLGEMKNATSPMLPLLLSLDEFARAMLFIHHVSWLESFSSLSKDRAVWLFALFAVLDKPLDADTSASVRALLRKCASLRAIRTKDDEDLPMLNILITIAGKYFGQAEDLLSSSKVCNSVEVTT